MKNKPVLLLILPFLLTSCSSSVQSKIYCFDTFATIELFDGKKKDVEAIENIFYTYDKLTDNYHDRGVNNLYTINHTNDEVVVSPELYEMFKKMMSSEINSLPHFDVLCGNLTKLWKEAIEKNEVLDYVIVSDEVLKMYNTTYQTLDNSVIKRTGETELDFGAIAKGYTLDKVYSYLDANKLHKYIINAGSSSILLGEKNNKTGLFNIGLEDLDNAYLQLKNCFISTSSISKQSVVIDGVTYCHIIDPYSGSATPVNDAVVVITQNGMFGDALSTSMMHCTLEEIKKLETLIYMKILVINDGQITYQSKGLEVFYH